MKAAWKWAWWLAVCVIYSGCTPPPTQPESLELPVRIEFMTSFSEPVAGGRVFVGGKEWEVEDGLSLELRLAHGQTPQLLTGICPASHGGVRHERRLSAVLGNGKTRVSYRFVCDVTEREIALSVQSECDEFDLWVDGRAQGKGVGGVFHGSYRIGDQDPRWGAESMQLVLSARSTDRACRLGSESAQEREPASDERSVEQRVFVKGAQGAVWARFSAKQIKKRQRRRLVQPPSSVRPYRL